MPIPYTSLLCSFINLNVYLQSISIMKNQNCLPKAGVCFTTGLVEIHHQKVNFQSKPLMNLTIFSQVLKNLMNHTLLMTANYVHLHVHYISNSIILVSSVNACD